MLTQSGKTYAQIMNGIVHWIFTSSDLPEYNENTFIAVDVTTVSPQPQIGWSAGEVSGTWTFTAPAGPNSAQLAAAAAEAAIAAGVIITSAGTPALNSTYSLSQTSITKLTGTIVNILADGTFPGAESTQPWPDSSGDIHVFNDLATFKAFATAIAGYYSAVSTYGDSGGTHGSLPSNALSII